MPVALEGLEQPRLDTLYNGCWRRRASWAPVDDALSTPEEGTCWVHSEVENADALARLVYTRTAAAPPRVPAPQPEVGAWPAAAFAAC